MLPGRSKNFLICLIERVEALRLSAVKVEKVVKKLQCSKRNVEMILIVKTLFWIEEGVGQQRASTRICSQVVMNES